MLPFPPVEFPKASGRSSRLSARSTSTVWSAVKSKTFFWVNLWSWKTDVKRLNLLEKPTLMKHHVVIVVVIIIIIIIIIIVIWNCVCSPLSHSHTKSGCFIANQNVCLGCLILDFKGPGLNWRQGTWVLRSTRHDNSDTTWHNCSNFMSI